MKKIILIFLLISSGITFAQESCYKKMAVQFDKDKSSLPKYCKEYSKMPPVIARSSDKTQLPNLMQIYENRGDMLSTPTESQKRKIKDVVEIYKSKLKEKILNRSNGAVSSYQKFLIDRLDKLKVTINNDENCLSPINASYGEFNNVLNFCESTANMPIEALYLIIGHELAHAIDFCSTDVAPLPEKMVKEIKAGNLRGVNCIETPENRKFVFKQLKALIDQGGTYVKNYDPLHEDMIELLEDCGVKLIKHDYSESLIGYPFADLRNCSSKIISKSEILNSEEVEEYLKQKNRGHFLEDDYRCLSKSKENFADQLSAELTEELLSEKKIELRPDKQDLLLYQWKMELCLSQSKDNGNYPTANQRMGNFLNKPIFQKIYNCNGYDGKNICQNEKLNHSSLYRPKVQDSNDNKPVIKGVR